MDAKDPKWKGPTPQPKISTQSIVNLLLLGFPKQYGLIL
jgi:hypothetical protein